MAKINFKKGLTDIVLYIIIFIDEYNTIATWR